MKTIFFHLEFCDTNVSVCTCTCLFCFPDRKSWSHEEPLISSSLDLTWCFLFLMTLSQGCAIHFQVFPSHLCLRNWKVLMNCPFISVKFILTWTFGLLLLLFTGEGDDRGGRWSGRGDGQRIHGWILWAGGFLSFFFSLCHLFFTLFCFIYPFMYFTDAMPVEFGRPRQSQQSFRMTFFP